MGEVLYEKKYPKESPEDLEELQKQLDSEEIEEHEMPTVEEFFRRLEEDYLYILLPERKKKVANFIRTARKVSQLYELDITIKKHVGHISAEFCFDASPCLKYLLDVIRLADDITFFANIRGYEIISGDNAGYYALSNTEVTTSGTITAAQMTGTVTFDGSAVYDTPLTATYTGNATSVTYQWYKTERGGTTTAISGATGETYTPIVRDVDSTLYVIVTAIDTNHTGTVRSQSLTVGRLPGSITIGCLNVTYGQTPSPYVVSNTNPEAAVWYTYTGCGDTEYAANRTPLTEAGTYSVSVYVELTMTHSAATSNTVEFSILPADSSVSAPPAAAQDLVYTGHSQALVTAGTAVGGTEFAPNATLSRAMVWAILARIDGKTVTGAHWIDTARTWVMANGVSDGTDPNGNVTREQLATMLWRYAGEPESSYSLAAFTDAGSVSDYAATAMAWAVENGIITGMTDTALAPQGTATRAQCAAMLMRFVEL